MGKLHSEISRDLRAFIDRQPMFFVATAPSGPGGHVNLSPKGLAALRVLGPREVAYLDAIGSGAETIAHLRDNGRITVMFCAFDGAPNIVRLYGTGEVIEPQDAAFTLLQPAFGDATPGTRAIIRIRVHRIAEAAVSVCQCWRSRRNGRNCRPGPAGRAPKPCATTSGRTIRPASTGCRRCAGPNKADGPQDDQPWTTAEDRRRDRGHRS